MREVLFQIGGLRIFSYGFFVAVGILVATIWLVQQVKKEGKSPDVVIDTVLIGVIAGIIGARLFYIFLYEPEYYLANPLRILYTWEGGLAFYGGLLLGFVCILIYLFRVRIPILTFLDLAAPATALGYGIARFGCFMNGCCYGKVTTVPWGVVFPVIDGATRHPTQLYSILSSFLIFIILLWIKRRGARFRGQLFSLALILYGLSRSVIELFRENTQLSGGSMEASMAALSIAAFGGIIYLFLFLAKRRGVLRL
ncbi:MAG TPA: prolipoprotein diacylglyceryl transferase [Peptococcaceae bacterium]|jgi:phosphatidylglycerol:prolipoprotein diacylglycerol transferase|nr:prolipoprotein diacylglyceryl transferase [Peptococcaceae bacterium]